MSERVIFLDIDGPVIPYSMVLVDLMCSWHRIIPLVTVAVVREVCQRAEAKVVFNTTHNLPLENVPNIESAIVTAGLPEKLIHPDMKTKYPDMDRDLAVLEWLGRHPDTDWIAFDDDRFTDKENLIWVDPNAGLHLGHLNTALDWWRCPQFQP